MMGRFNLIQLKFLQPLHQDPEVLISTKSQLQLNNQNVRKMLPKEISDLEMSLIQIPWLESPRPSSAISGVVHSGSTASQGGEAIANLLTGKTNPSGKLAQNWVRSAGQAHSGASPFLQWRVGKWVANSRGELGYWTMSERLC